MIQSSAMLARFPLALGLALWLTAWTSQAQAQNVDIVAQQLDGDRHGYTVMRVWGTHQDMGYAMGFALAPDILQGIGEIRLLTGSNYATLRGALAETSWPVAGIEDEIAGMVAGVTAAEPTASIDAVDIKVFNTYSDWGYACRSHQCWGSRAAAPMLTLSTRRLDFGTPFPTVLHHVLCAWEPSDGSVRWVNLAWPGYVAVVTGVNEHGTLVSLHDYDSSVAYESSVVPRSIATRLVLSDVGQTAASGQLGWAQTELAGVAVATGTFLNYYVPEGHGGVFTCPPGQGCGVPRVPQSDFLGGEVLITTNSQTDGHGYPSGSEFLTPFYADAAPKTVQAHFESMGNDGLHLLTVGYRGPGDMLLWAEGRQATGTTPRIEVEWTELFGAGPGPGPDAGADAGSDAGTGAGGTGAGGGTGASSGSGGDGGASDGSESGCGCRVGALAPAAGGALLGLLLPLALTARRRRRVGEHQGSS